MIVAPDIGCFFYNPYHADHKELLSHQFHHTDAILLYSRRHIGKKGSDAQWENIQQGHVT